MSVRDLVPWRRAKSNLAVRDPFEEFFGIQSEMNRMFDSFLTDFDLARPAGPSFSPAVDIKEKDGSIAIVAELPGLDEKDIEVSFENNSLVLKGEKKAEKEEDIEGFHRVERSYGSFYRRIPIPAEIKEDEIKADFSKGVLSVNLPKVNGAKSKSVKINVK